MKKLYVLDVNRNKIYDDWEENSSIAIAFESFTNVNNENTDLYGESFSDSYKFFTDETAFSVINKFGKFRNPIADNLLFQKKYDFDKDPIDIEKLKFRMSLLKEEYEETLLAMEEKNAEEWVDGHIDLVVIALGNLHLAGVDVNKAWNEVFQANMSKVRGIKPGREASGGFDVIKPEGWKAPDHSGNHGDLHDIFG